MGNGAALLALSSQGIKLSVTGDSVSLGYLPERRFVAIANIINRHRTPINKWAPDFAAIHCLPKMIQVRFRGHHAIKPIGPQLRH